MANPGANVEALANLQADELQKLSESLQGIAAARTGVTPTDPQPSTVPAETTGEGGSILWEKVSTGNVVPQEVPPTRPPTTNGPNTVQKRDDPAISPQPLLTQQYATTLSETFSKQRQENALTAYPAIFDLKENEISPNVVSMSTLTSFPRQERPALLIIVTQPTRHIRFFFGIEKLPFPYANRTTLDGHILAFSRDIFAGDKPPTIEISDEWWDRKDRPVPSQQTAATKVSKIRPEDHIITKEATGADRASIPLAWIAPLTVIHPLLTAPYTSPLAAYTLL